MFKTSAAAFSDRQNRTCCHESSQGYYHWVLGCELSSPAAIAAYFSSLIAAVESVSFISGMFTTTEFKVARGFYCAYDPFSRLDLRCELSVPGGVRVAAIDAQV